MYICIYSGTKNDWIAMIQGFWGLPLLFAAGESSRTPATPRYCILGNPNPTHSSKSNMGCWLAGHLFPIAVRLMSGALS